MNICLLSRIQTANKHANARSCEYTHSLSPSLPLALSHAHTPFSQNRRLNLAHSPCVSGSVFHHCQSRHAPAPGQRSWDVPWFTCVWVFLFLLLFLFLPLRAGIRNSQPSLCNNKQHYVVWSKTPVSLKVPWGVTLLAAHSKLALSNAVYWQRPVSAVNLEIPPCSKHYRTGVTKCYLYRLSLRVNIL